MICPICGRENPPESKKCINCGTRFKALEKFLSKRQAHTAAPKVRFRFKGLLSMAAVIAILATIALGSFFLFSQQEPPASSPAAAFDPLGSFVYAAHEVSAYAANNRIHILWDKSLIATFDGLFVEDQQWSLDRSAYAFKTDDNCLITVRNGQTSMQSITAPLHSFSLSANGETLLYAAKISNLSGVHYGLYLHSLVGNYTNTIDIVDDLMQMRISPDGKKVVYTVLDEKYVSRRLFYYTNGNVVDLGLTDDCQLLSVSNNGLIYLSDNTDSGKINLYVASQDSSITLFGISDTASIRLNADHSQLLYHSNMHTFIYDGSTASKISNRIALPVLPPQVYWTDEMQTMPIDSFYDHVYTDSLKQAFYIRQDPSKTRQLTQAGESYTLDHTGEYLYYLADGQLRCLQVNVPGAEYTTIARHVDHNYFAVTSDRKYVYYVNGGTLYCYDANKPALPQALYQPMEVNEGILISLYFTLDNQDILYFRCEDIIYIVQEAMYPEILLDGVESMYTRPNLTVMLYTNDATYIADGTNPPIKLPKGWGMETAIIPT